MHHSSNHSSQLADAEHIERFFKSRLKLSHIRVLAAFSALGQINKVADLLHVTHSAVSKQVSEMELALGARLFVRNGKKLELTPVGERLALRSRGVLHELDSARDELQALSKGFTGKVRIGTVTTLTHALVPSSIVAFHDELPQASVSIMESTADNLLALLVRGELDVILTRGHSTFENLNTELVRQPIGAEPLVIVAGRAHPLADMEPDDWRVLGQHSWVVPMRSSPPFLALEALLFRHNVRLPEGCVESLPMTINTTLVASGKFLALLPLSLSQTLEKGGSLVILPLDTTGLLSEVLLTWRSSEARVHTLTMLNAVRATAKAFFPSPVVPD